MCCVSLGRASGAARTVAGELVGDEDGMLEGPFDGVAEAEPAAELGGAGATRT